MNDNERPFLSLCMIIKNGERTLPNLLDSVSGCFDEYVFVDTGSTDSTKKILSDWKVGEYARFGKNIIIENFEWIDDFAAARNFSFSLSTAKWRMYLDADDKLIHGKVVRDVVSRIEKEKEAANCISMKYVYIAGETEQTVRRIFKCESPTWGDDWVWKRAIHEEAVRGKSPNSGNVRIQAPVTGPEVHHDKSVEEGVKSHERNIRIMRRVYDDPTTTQKERAEIAYHIANYYKYCASAGLNGISYADIIPYLDECIAQCAEINIGMYAAMDKARVLVELDEHEAALDVAGKAAARAPEFREPLLMQAWIHSLRQHDGRAVGAYEEANTRLGIGTDPLDEIWFTQGRVPAQVAMSYLRMGALEKARAALDSIPLHVRTHPAVRDFASDATSRLMTLTGMKRFKDFFDFLLWNTDPVKARTLLKHCVPSAIAPYPFVSKLERELKAKTYHLDSAEGYRKAYAAIPPTTYHTDPKTRDEIVTYSRAIMLFDGVAQMFAQNPGKSLRMLSIGSQDGVMEEKLLEKHENLHMTVVDVAPQANSGLSLLVDKFPGRVTRHFMSAMKNTEGGDFDRSLYDWYPPNEKFDIISFFEVWEHVPDEDFALQKIRGGLSEGGVAFFSTPVADRWIEPHLTTEDGPEMYWHVRAHNHVSLWEKLKARGFDGAVWEGFDGVFCAMVEKAAWGKFSGPKVSIYVPYTPKPFDALSPYEGFCGGSEEAVVYLARELAALNFDVTVFAPERKRDDGRTLRVIDGVLWRDVAEFDVEGDHENVLLWRAPGLAMGAEFSRRKYKVWHWLHDAEYAGTPAKCFGAVDGVMVLSKHHERCIRAFNDPEGLGKYFQVLNGIDPDAFPAFTPEREQERDPYRMIYSSSPDRGLVPLLAMWPKIREQVPEARLEVFYDWSQLRKLRPDFYNKVASMVLSLKDQGVTHHGGVDQPTLHAWMRRSSVWVYLNDGDVETSCITAMKMMASGVIPLTTTAGALAETLGVWRKEPTLQNIVHFLKPRPEYAEIRAQMRKDALERFSWKKVAEGFAEIISPDLVEERVEENKDVGATQLSAVQVNP